MTQDVGRNVEIGKSGVCSFFASLLFLSPVSVNAAECTYRVARDFRNIQAELYRGNVSSSDVAELLFETGGALVRRDAKTNTIEPGLAQAWDFDADSQSYVFTLNQSCHWSDGTPLVADDIVYGIRETYSIGSAPSVGGNMIAGAEDVIEHGAPLSTLQVKALGDNKVRIGITGDPDVALMYLAFVSYSPLPSHVPNAEHLSLASTNRLSIGPFRVHSVTKNLIVLDRNPYYCADQKISVDRIELSNRKSGYWEFSEVMNGRLDLARYTSEKPLQVLQKTARENPHVRVEVIDEHRQTYLTVNPLSVGLANAEIRRNIHTGIDYISLANRGNSTAKVRKVAETLFYDLANYENYQYSKLADSYEKGIESLQVIMEKYGYSNKNRLKAKIITYPLERFETTAKMLASMLRQAYFDITFVKSQSTYQVLEDALTGRFDMYFNSWSLDYADPQSSLDGLLQVMGYLLEDVGENVLSVELKENFVDPFKTLLAELEQSRDQNDRFRKLHSIETLLLESGVIIPLYTEHSSVVVSSKIGPLSGEFPHSWTVNMNDCDEQGIVK